jgi:hypothetical protein
MSAYPLAAYFFGWFFLIGLIYHGEFRKVQYFMTSGAKLFVLTICLLAVSAAARLVAEVW